MEGCDAFPIMKMAAAITVLAVLVPLTGTLIFSILDRLQTIDDWTERWLLLTIPLIIFAGLYLAFLDIAWMMSP